MNRSIPALHSALLSVLIALLWLIPADAQQPIGSTVDARIAESAKAQRAARLRRGLQVHKEVCSACHALNISFARLHEPGGPALTRQDAQALAADYQKSETDMIYGENFERPARLSDPFPSPFLNDGQARAANGGFYPPDLSEFARLRPDAAAYITALLTSYEDKPAREGTYYNSAFEGGQIGMADQLEDGRVTFQDGTDPTVANMARDVAAFYEWTATPDWSSRRITAVRTFLYFSSALVIGFLLAMPLITAGRDRRRQAKER